MSVEIGVICTLLGALLGYLGFRRNENKDIKEDAKSNAHLSTTLAYISKGVDDIRLDIKAQDRRTTDIDSRLIRVEESSKSAHKRIDTLEKEGV
ncbi:hypothetical protein [Clostridium hydrogeniformans]|uniref:hypothetical protein n=1 Tax=Clostridium hydrogeniformans TaxID=349933 RepID=UPI000487EE9B|nr:hypothetical protein [Clostridium hydrogeniformans]